MLGVNVLPSLLRYIDAPEWKDEVDELGANIGTYLTTYLDFTLALPYP